MLLYQQQGIRRDLWFKTKILGKIQLTKTMDLLSRLDIFCMPFREKTLNRCQINIFFKGDNKSYQIVLMQYLSVSYCGKTNSVVTVGAKQENYRCGLRQSIGYIKFIMQKRDRDPKQINH